MKSRILETTALLTLAAFLASCAGGQAPATPPASGETDATAVPAEEQAPASAPAAAAPEAPAAPQATTRPTPKNSSSGRTTSQGQPATTTPVHQAPAATAPAPAPARKMVTVPEGKKITVALDNGISSADSKTGDPFTATITKTVHLQEGSLSAVPEGAHIEGTLSAVEAAKRGPKSQARIEMQFQTLILPDGTRIPIAASFASEAESRKGRNAGTIAGGAAAGAFLGHIIGKDGKDALIGAVVGGAIGTGIVMGTPGKEIDLPAGTSLQLHLDKAVEVPQPVS